MTDQGLIFHRCWMDEASIRCGCGHVYKGWGTATHYLGWCPVCGGSYAGPAENFKGPAPWRNVLAKMEGKG